MDSDGAKARLYELIEEKLGYTKDQITINNFLFSDENNWWVMSALVINAPSDNDGLIVIRIDNDGNLAGELKAPEKRPLDLQLQYEIKTCFFLNDCHLRLAELTDKWVPILEALPQEELDKIKSHHLAVVGLGITVPADGSISYDDAYQLAIQYALEQPELSQEKFEMFRLCMCAYYTPADIGKPVYFFDFSRLSYSDKNAAKLKKLFGEREYQPSSFCLMVDAMDGSLVETPFLYYPAQAVHHYLDFLIRTDEVIESIKGDA